MVLKTLTDLLLYPFFVLIIVPLLFHVFLLLARSSLIVDFSVSFPFFFFFLRNQFLALMLSSVASFSVLFIFMICFYIFVMPLFSLAYSLIVSLHFLLLFKDISLFIIELFKHTQKWIGIMNPLYLSTSFHNQQYILVLFNLFSLVLILL